MALGQMTLTLGSLAILSVALLIIADDPLCADLPKDKVVKFPSILDCDEYYQCLNGDLSIVPCPDGLWFSEKLEECVEPIKSGCNRTNEIPTTSATTLPDGRTPAITTLEPSSTTSKDESTTEKTTDGSGTTDGTGTTAVNTDTTTVNTDTTTVNTDTTTVNTDTTTVNTETTTDGSSSTPQNTPTTEPATTLAPSTTAHPGNPICPKTGTEYFPDPLDCTRYIECYNGHSYEMNCPQGSRYSSVQKRCLPEKDVECKVAEY